jgi:MFS transporter, PAT family, beta-lactamase induction signal transducer AmpG
MSATPITSTTSSATRNPWAWIPTLYYGQGIPYVIVNMLSVAFYKNMGMSNTDIAFYTSWLNLPWVIKPLWSPLIDMFRTKRIWIIAMQLLVGAGMGAVALTIPAADYVRYSLAVFWLIAFASATHDIAADGFYMLALPQHQQAAFVGVRSAFYRAAMLTGQGGLVWLAGQFIEMTGQVVFAWQIVFGILAVMFALLTVYHFFVLERPASDVTKPISSDYLSDFFGTFRTFFVRKNILIIVAFLLLYRFGEVQALKLVAPFLLDPIDKGGLGLNNKQLGFIYGGVGVAALTLGGISGGLVISKFGLKKCIWPMLLVCHIPNLAFVALAAYQPTSQLAISVAIAVEQFGYGFGFTAYLMFMIMVADGWGTSFEGNNPDKTAHYAICTGFMAASVMIPGLFSGKIQSILGYQNFFIYVCIAALPSFLVAYFVKIDPMFGRKKAEESKSA